MHALQPLPLWRRTAAVAYFRLLSLVGHSVWLARFPWMCFKLASNLSWNTWLTAQHLLQWNQWNTGPAPGINIRTYTNYRGLYVQFHRAPATSLTSAAMERHFSAAGYIGSPCRRTSPATRPLQQRSAGHFLFFTRWPYYNVVYSEYIKGSL